VPQLSGFGFAEVQFTKEGRVHDPSRVEELLALLDAEPISDLLVISHGWNNDMQEARELYRDFFARVREVIDSGAVPGASDRSYAVLGVLWPSKRFAERDLIPGGAASASGTGDDDVHEGLEELARALDDPATEPALSEAERLVPRLEGDPAARARFADLVRSVLAAEESDDEDASSELFDVPGEELMDRLRTPVGLGPPPGPPGGGGAAGLGSLVGDIKGAARGLANFATYYKMKERSGLVGRTGLHAVLRQVRERRRDLRLHLIGHSFGARLVTAAAAEGNAEAVSPRTLTLLQAAFSHHGFARHWDGVQDGLFRRVVADGLVAGPVLITCTRNDAAVGRAYPIASQIARQAASWLGDKNDRYGGLGSNGAQKTPEAVDGALLGVGGHYAFEPRQLHNLNADAYVANHSDICGPEVAYALLTAVQRADLR
jgi:pimeloyl-ACP methyl ester carboxylesterase